MALHNEILVGRFNRWLQKLTGIKAEPPAPQLASEISPNLQFLSGVEDRAMQGWFRFGVSILLAAGTNNASVRLRNNAGSNRLVVFEKLKAGSDAATRVALETQTLNTDLASVVAASSNMAWDKRMNQGSPVVISSDQNGNPALSLLRDEVVLTLNSLSQDFLVTDDQEVILSPGEAIQMRCITLNTTLRVAGEAA